MSTINITLPIHEVKDTIERAISPKVLETMHQIQIGEEKHKQINTDNKKNGLKIIPHKPDQNKLPRQGEFTPHHDVEM